MFEVWKSQRDILIDATEEVDYVLENLSLQILFNAELSHDSRTKILETLDVARRMLKTSVDNAKEV